MPLRFGEIVMQKHTRWEGEKDWWSRKIFALSVSVIKISQ